MLVKLKLLSFDCLLFLCHWARKEVVGNMCLFKSFEVGCISKSIDLQRESWLEVASLTYVLDINWPYSRLCKAVHNLRVNLGNL
jgi:hypothetical protein